MLKQSDLASVFNQFGEVQQIPEQLRSKYLSLYTKNQKILDEWQNQNSFHLDPSDFFQKPEKNAR